MNKKYWVGTPEIKKQPEDDVEKGYWEKVNMAGKTWRNEGR